MGLAIERLNLVATGLSQNIVEQLWRWTKTFVVAYQGSDILSFLQDMQKGLVFSTIKLYLAAFLACHLGFGFGNKTVGQHPQFMRWAHWLFGPVDLDNSWLP